MSPTKILLSGFVILALSQQGCGQEDTEQRAGWQFPSFSGFGSSNLGGFELPNFGNSDSGSGSGLPFNLPSFGGLPSIPGLGSIFSRPSTTRPPSTAAQESTTASDRKRREVDESDSSEEHNRHNPRFPEIVSCNYTEQPLPTCVSCTQTLQCFPNNLGILTTCGRRFRHCNGGLCSHTRNETCIDT